MSKRESQTERESEGERVSERESETGRERDDRSGLPSSPHQRGIKEKRGKTRLKLYCTGN